MPDFTRPLAIGLDARRKVLRGEGETLLLLRYADATQRGYVLLGIVERGWYLKGGEGDEASELQIAESEFFSEALFDQLDGFAINSAVYKVDENRFEPPRVPNKRVWKFFVKPSGESFEEES